MAIASLRHLWAKPHPEPSVASSKVSDRFAARTVQFLQNANGSRTLVLGLNWRAILISGGAVTALDRARAAGATHYCMVGAQTLAYGRVVSDKHQAIPEQVYPAALLASRLTSSEGFFALTVSPTEVWVAVVRSGRPHGFDELLTDTTGNLAVLVRDWLVGIREQYNTSWVYTDVALDLPDVKTQPCSWTRLMNAPVMAKDVLVVLPHSSWLARLQIPTSVMRLALGMTALWLANSAWEFWRTHLKAEAELALAAEQRQSDEPTMRWQHIFNGLGASRVHPDSETLAPVRQSLGKLPTHWENWKLKAAQCKEISVQKGQQTWNCSASYVPHEGMGVATNQQLNAAVPEGFKAKFVSLKLAALEWSLVCDAPPLNVAKLPTKQHHVLETSSLLQRYEAAITSAPELVFSPIKIAPPQTTHGTSIALPTTLQLPSEAPLSLRGPLRSIDAILARGLSAQWRAISLTYVDAKALSSGLRDSVLETQLEGVLYAKD